jgi:spore coat polysaccharide biosynthesis protein SpsF (cytidylyltransferase family)
MRITSDCPLIDPELCGEVLAVLAASGADYVCNNLPPLWPHGLDCDAFPVEHLARAAREAVLAADREHVTLWLKRNPRLDRISIDGPGGGMERHRWTLDFAEDYEFFQALWAVMGERAGEADTAELLAAIAAHPEIAARNRAHIDEERLGAASLGLERRLPSRSCQARGADHAASSTASRRWASSQSVLVSEAKRNPGSTGNAPSST